MVKKIIKENIKLLIGIIIGAVIFAGGAYATSIAAKDASYDNTSSNLTSTNVQSALDELYTKSSTSACELKENKGLLKVIKVMQEYYVQVGETGSIDPKIMGSRIVSSAAFPEKNDWFYTTSNNCGIATSKVTGHRNCFLNAILNQYESICN